jgi:hypothetical protein
MVQRLMHADSMKNDAHRFDEKNDARRFGENDARRFGENDARRFGEKPTFVLLYQNGYLTLHHRRAMARPPRPATTRHVPRPASPNK